MTADVGSLMDSAERAAREGRSRDVRSALNRVEQCAPPDARVLNMLGNRSLAIGSTEAAVRLFERAVLLDSSAAALWLNLALARQQRGDAQGELAALDAALAADPYFLLALLHKAVWFERQGQMTEAARLYRSLLDAAPPADRLTPALREALGHGRALVAQQDAEIGAAIEAAIPKDAVRTERFDHCVDVLAGRRKIYVHQPAGVHYPYLPAIQFFDRSLFPWFSKLEAKTEAIRSELLSLVAAGIPNEPYVQVAKGAPVNQWGTLNHSLAWGALFLWKDGRRSDEVLARCPETAELIGELPLLDIPERGPTVMFSTLQPGARIPPHTGVTNTRAVVHLPLIVPPGCGFRVGSETREWRPGEAWAFDDTIEHEAWNESDQTRVILILDAWNPLLDQSERALLRSVNAVLSGLGRGGPSGAY